MAYVNEKHNFIIYLSCHKSADGSFIFGYHLQIRKKLPDPEMANKFFKMLAGKHITVDKEESDIQSFTIKQLNRPITFVLYLYGIAIIIFVSEYIMCKWENWRNRKLVIYVYSLFKWTTIEY